MSAPKYRWHLRATFFLVHPSQLRDACNGGSMCMRRTASSGSCTVSGFILRGTGPAPTVSDREFTVRFGPERWVTAADGSQVPEMVHPRTCVLRPVDSKEKHMVKLKVVRDLEEPHQEAKP